MVILLVPSYALQLDIDYIEHLVGVGAPSLLDGSSPSLGDDRRDGEVGSKPVLEDAAINFVIFIYCFHRISVGCSQIMLVE